MENHANSLGNIFISHRTIASIAFQAVIETYGVVGLAPKNLARGIASAITKDPMTGIDVHLDTDMLIIDLYIIVEYGTRIKTVTSSVASLVKYKVEKTIGIPVSQVNVHVRGLRISDTD